MFNSKIKKIIKRKFPKAKWIKVVQPRYPSEQIIVKEYGREVSICLASADACVIFKVYNTTMGGFIYKGEFYEFELPVTNHQAYRYPANNNGETTITLVSICMVILFGVCTIIDPGSGLILGLVYFALTLASEAYTENPYRRSLWWIGLFICIGLLTWSIITFSQVVMKEEAYYSELCFISVIKNEDINKCLDKYPTRYPEDQLRLLCTRMNGDLFYIDDHSQSNQYKFTCTDSQKNILFKKL